jgi:hypothetical protein
MPRSTQRRPTERGTAVPLWVFLVILASLGVITAVGCVS